ncbi:MerR family transcriptional regulator [Cellulomonas triticagri]|uniref:MerR family transcriptional regulator n=1 Tax=Cellulomonas triticagri TaxID=2483352 RepID=A0A3M2J9T1_9CELL|nr:MerR family transcriptional regulator [Cellulomonas triticagri]RMI08876.1 MerR family transcriptional regulator [Cellulomonas triticagri]
MSPDRLLTFGEFSRLSLLSVRMLRHYDEHAVLPPTHVDPASGYRLYHPALLRTAQRVRALRDAGVGVADLAACAPFDDVARLREVLRERRRVTGEEIARAQDRVRDIDRFLDTLGGPAMSTTITRTTLPARRVAAVRGTIPTYADEGVLWQRLAAGLAAAGAAPVPGAAAVALFHDEGYVERDPEVEVQLDVQEPFAGAADGVRYVEEPAVDVVVGELHGPYDGVGDVMAALGAWIAEHGLRVAGPMRNVYVVGPATEPDPTAWVTRVCLPVAAA